MRTCQIQWIDDQGNPTPDHNPAVAMIQCKGYPLKGNPSYKPNPSEIFACCATHLAQMPNDGIWTVVETLTPEPSPPIFAAWHNVAPMRTRAIWERCYGKVRATVEVMHFRCMVDLYCDGKRVYEGLPARTLREAKIIGNRWLRVMRLYDAAARNARTFKWWSWVHASRALCVPTANSKRLDRRAARMAAINRRASRTDTVVARMVGIDA